MSADFLRFFIRLTVFSGLLALGLLAWNQWGPIQYIHPLSWVLLIFFILVTALIHYRLMRSAENDPKVFVRTFMGLTSLKLFVFFLIIVLYGFAFRQKAVAFTLHFLVFYLLFTSFEVASLYKYLRPKK